MRRGGRVGGTRPDAVGRAEKRMRFRQDPVDEGYRGLRCRRSHPVLRQFARAPVRRVRYRLYRVGTGDPRCGGRGVPPSVILACGEGITLDADAEAFVVAVPAQTFAAGFTVEIVDPEGHLMRMRSDKEQVVSAGKMLAMPAVAFAPTETVAETEIRSAADMLALAEMSATASSVVRTIWRETSIWLRFRTGKVSESGILTMRSTARSTGAILDQEPQIGMASLQLHARRIGDQECHDRRFVRVCEYPVARRQNKSRCIGRHGARCGRGLREQCQSILCGYERLRHLCRWTGRSYLPHGTYQRLREQRRCVGSRSGVREGRMRGGVLGTFDRSDDAGDTAEVHSNTNNGTVTNSSDVKTLCVGGVVGRSSNGTCVIRTASTRARSSPTARL